MVQFDPWFKFYLPLCWGMVMCDNEFKTGGSRIYCVNIDLRHQYRISVAEAVPPGETSQAARSKEKPRGGPGGETTVFAG